MNNGFFDDDFKIEPTTKESEQDVNEVAQNPDANADGQLDDRNLSDDFVIGQDFFIDSTEADIMAEAEQNKTLGKQKKKKKISTGKSCLTSMIWMAIIFILAISLASAALYFGTDYLGVSLSDDATEMKEIVVAKGTSAKEVADKLEDYGIIKSSLFFRFYAKASGYDDEFQYGVYHFCKQDSYEDIAEALTKKGALTDVIQITIPEGFSIDQIAKRLEEKGVCKASAFKTAVNEASYEKYKYEFMNGIVTQSSGVHYRLEGYLFPDTYKFFVAENETGIEMIINKMLSNLDKKLKENGLYERAEQTGMSIHDTLTLASVIEMESSIATYEDKQKVSAVFHNRLNNWEGELRKLQSDPTSKYPYNPEFYDTYKATGLAPGAYCSPSIDSIKAALYPDEACEAYYFVTDKEMNFYYNETLKGHNQTINKLKKDGKWA